MSFLLFVGRPFFYFYKTSLSAKALAVRSNVVEDECRSSDLTGLSWRGSSHWWGGLLFSSTDLCQSEGTKNKKSSLSAPDWHHGLFWIPPPYLSDCEPPPSVRRTSRPQLSVILQLAAQHLVTADQTSSSSLPYAFMASASIKLVFFCHALNYFIHQGGNLKAGSSWVIQQLDGEPQDFKSFDVSLCV